MAHSTDFTSSLKELPEVNATVGRWLYGTKELERRISERIVSLCRYFDRIPEESLPGYVNALIEALNSEELESGFIESEHLGISITNFIKHLKSLGDPAEAEKADLILKKVREKFQLDK
jgi:hypothetical protein